MSQIVIESLLFKIKLDLQVVLQFRHFDNDLLSYRFINRNRFPSLRYIKKKNKENLHKPLGLFGLR